MEIKFWDKHQNRYDTINTYFVSENGVAMELFGGMDASLEPVDHIDAHFYLNNERIA